MAVCDPRLPRGFLHNSNHVFHFLVGHTRENGQRQTGVKLLFGVWKVATFVPVCPLIVRLQVQRNKMNAASHASIIQFLNEIIPIPTQAVQP
jgi:hypothetical protein